MKKFWNWYDTIKEPWRFLFMLFVLMLPFHLFTFSNNPIWLLLLLAIVVSKIRHHNKL